VSLVKTNFSEEINRSFNYKRNWKNITNLFLGIVVILIIYFVFRNLVHFDALQFLKDMLLLKHFPELGKNASFGLLLVLGFLTSFHCLGMCGGIAISQSIGNKPNIIAIEEKNRHAGLASSILYNLGRVIGYTVVGGIVGGVGQAISFSGVWKGFVPIAGGLFMIIMGINLLEIFPVLRRLNIRMPLFAAKKLKGNNNYSPFYVGLLSGLMPCGPLQIVQLYAMGTGSAVWGALSMFVFSAGTAPLLFAFGAASSIINKKYTGRILKVSAALVIFLGLVMVGRGLALSGVMMHSPAALSGDAGVARIEGNVQIVATAIEKNSFPPIIVQKGIPVKWVLKADAQDLNECNKAITIPKFNISKDLNVGDNLVEFTPQEAGDIVYTCWMGMIKSKISVVDDLSKINSDLPNVPGESGTAAANPPAMQGARTAQPAECMDKMQDYCVGKENNANPQPARNDQAAQNTGHDAAAVAQSATPPAAQVKATTLVGYLIDKHCFELMSPEEDTRVCLTMEECEASGYGLAVKQEDGIYKFYFFDQNGRKLAKEYLAKTIKSNNFRIAVVGTMDGDLIKVTSISDK